MNVNFMLATIAFAFVAACGTSPQTYRDLDRLGQDYQSPPQNADEATRADTCGAARFRNLIGEEVATIDPGDRRSIAGG